MSILDNTNKIKISLDMFDDFPQSFITCKVVYKEDYENSYVKVLHANRHFYTVARLDKKRVINKRITEIFPKLKTCIFDWEKIVSEIAMTHKSKVIEQYFEAFDKFLRLYVFGFSDGVFHVLITDLTTQKTINRRMLERDRQLAYFEGELSNRASKDNLTCVYNYQFLMQSLADNIKLFNLGDTTFCVQMIYIDNIRDMNIEYGYEAVDELLKDFATFLLEFTRKIDIIGRYTGDKFVIIYNNVDLDIARVLIDKLKIDIKKHFCVKRFPNLSINAAVLDYNGEKLEEFILRLDEKLTKSKELGNNVFL